MTIIQKKKSNTMKKTILFCMCLVAGITLVQAQTETLTLKPVKKGEEPKAVMDAIKRDFPKGIASDLSVLSSKMYGEQWSANLQDDTNGDVPNYYQVTIKEGKESLRAVYDIGGKMLSSKEVIVPTALPGDVMKTITAKYPGWKIINDREKISYKNGSTTEVYHVQIQQNKAYRNLFLDNTGKLVKDVQHNHV